MTIAKSTKLSRRSLLAHATPVAAAGMLSLAAPSAVNAAEPACDGEVLGQGAFRFRANRRWGVLNREEHPVNDCHGIAEDRHGRIILLTNNTRNNLIAYDKSGKFLAAWEHRFPTAHGLRIEDHAGEDRYWITDHDVQCLSVNTADGNEVLRVNFEAVAAKYADRSRYHPTNAAFAPDGDFFISDGYGSSYVHHFDPKGRYIASFGGPGESPANLSEPHAVWIDNRSGKPRVLVCDRGHEMLKWFSLAGELERMVPVPGARPSNVAPLRTANGKGHIAVASLNGMILILDAADRVVSVVGGEPAVYEGGKLQPLQVFNYTFNHPHDVYMDAAGAMYVPQWWSNQTYPIKLEPLGAS